MFCVMNRVPVAPEWREAFEERFRKRAGQVELQAGFVRMAVLRPTSDETPYVVETLWQDQGAFEAWIGSEDFKQAHANPLPKEAYNGEGKIETFDVVVSADASL
ncbi:antibiotic biosynthesis monooxygenase family protein [Halochromatium sp.]